MLSGDFISIFHPPLATGWFPEVFDCMIMSLPLELGGSRCDPVWLVLLARPSLAIEEDG